MEFQPGDVVELKSGGPCMTVEKTGKTSLGDEAVWVAWFEKVGAKQVVNRDTFAPAMLNKVDPNAGPVFITV